MKVSVFGLGYVGTVSAACLAMEGHDVVGVDVNPAKLAMIGEGRTPVVEERIGDIVRDVVASGRLTVTDDVTAAIHGTDLSLVCVGTPSASNGSLDTTYLQRAAREIGAALAARPTPPGDAAERSSTRRRSATRSCSARRCCRAPASASSCRCSRRPRASSPAPTSASR
jgi:GDP-mannose 6-dehydrogenase